MIVRAFALLAALVCAVPAVAQAPQPFTPEQRRAIEGVVRDFLLQNPEVLREAFNALEQREQANQAAAQATTIRENAEELFRTGRHAVLGNPQGDVTIVEFFDYNCSFCRRAFADTEQLLRTDRNLRLVVKEFPVLGPPSVEVSQISAQIHGDRRFAEFHRRMLQSQGTVGRERALSVARELGLDVRTLEANMRAPETMRAIEQAYRIANALNIGGTPTYVIGEEVVVGAVGVDELAGRIAAMRRCGRTRC